MERKTHDNERSDTSLMQIKRILMKRGFFRIQFCIHTYARGRYKFLVGGWRVTINFYDATSSPTSYERYRRKMLEKKCQLPWKSYDTSSSCASTGDRYGTLGRSYKFTREIAARRHQSSRATERLQILRFPEWLTVSKNLARFDLSTWKCTALRNYATRDANANSSLLYRLSSVSVP